MEHTEVVLEVRNLVKRFEGLVAVDQLNFKVRKGRIHALIGPNGAGKTTTVNMITGDNPQTEGDVLFYGKSISKLPVYARANLGIGRTFQNIKLFSTMTVLENNLMFWKVLPEHQIIFYHDSIRKFADRWPEQNHKESFKIPGESPHRPKRGTAAKGKG